MKRIIVTLVLFLFSAVSMAQYRVMGYYPNTQFQDDVIVYGYYQSDGTFTLSHCRTNRFSGDFNSDKTYLDINTCQIKPLPESGVAPVNPPS